MNFIKRLKVIKMIPFTSFAFRLLNDHSEAQIKHLNKLIMQVSNAMDYCPAIQLSISFEKTDWIIDVTWPVNIFA